MTRTGYRNVADDLSVQHLLQLSLISCPRNAKAWSHFASWCYRRGRRATEWEEEGSGPVLGLSGVEKEKVMTILGPEATPAQCEAVISTLQELRQCKSEDEDNLDIADTFRSLLPATTSDLENKLDQLMLLWGQRTQSHCYFHACAIAYFKFLQLCESQENSEESFAEATLTATLRLLRLIVKQATSLQDVLESGLALTPTTPWKGIIPQLFARLSHPESYVRRRLSELLCRLASDSPHLILFPAVVGCSLNKTTQKDDNLLSIQDTEEDEGDEEDDDEDEDAATGDDSQSSVLRSCFLSMVDILSQQAPASTAQVRLLVSELKRITVLWDELWLGCLVQHQADITRRLAQIGQEIKECEENESLSPEMKSQLAREKYRIIMKPIVVMLEHLVSITTVLPETPHEKMFQSNFSEIIEEALTNLKNIPENKAIKAESRWYPFQQLQIELQQQAHRRGGASFKLTEISPLLANLRDSAIAMPGLSQSQSLVTIAGIDNVVSVLPTKTRPKKLTLTGSDGRKYTYLFKGIEDLHLDERIMQFLGIANTMMARVQGSSYRARHYSVVPLGVRSGLISWVDGMQPMFSMYKRWQQRDVAIQQLRNNSTAPTTTLRPSELFYNKLNPLLTERGIAVENRKEWPVAVLKQVFLALVNETPKDLLAKELWCTSQNAADWWQVTRNYSRSVAVMSVIGYIIGLGDRHLDNLLINLLTGEVAHIDYNVCFEKGLTLRVPEKVPFRMTQNLQAALGVTGLEVGLHFIF
ncbi:hypothetical protein B566_EDAN004003 [Ephemera danica]|nr:hypothetical protein B566_EDAN004003 [Ephemera danica]